MVGAYYTGSHRAASQYAYLAHCAGPGRIALTDFGTLYCQTQLRNGYNSSDEEISFFCLLLEEEFNEQLIEI